MIRIEERLIALERALEELIGLSPSVPIIVEGKRDVASLRALGVPGRIEMVNRGNTLLQVCDALAERSTEVIVLTDWDRTGGHIMRHLRDNLQGRVRIHDTFRRTFAVYSEVKDVESLASYMSTLRVKVQQLTRTPVPAVLARPGNEDAGKGGPDGAGKGGPGRAAKGGAGGAAGAPIDGDELSEASESSDAADLSDEKG